MKKQLLLSALALGGLALTSCENQEFQNEKEDAMRIDVQQISRKWQRCATMSRSMP